MACLQSLNPFVCILGNQCLWDWLALSETLATVLEFKQITWSLWGSHRPCSWDRGFPGKKVPLSSQWNPALWLFVISLFRSLSHSLIFCCYRHRKTDSKPLTQWGNAPAPGAMGVMEAEATRASSHLVPLVDAFKKLSSGRLTCPSFRTKRTWDYSCSCLGGGSCKQWKWINWKGPFQDNGFWVLDCCPAKMSFHHDQESSISSHETRDALK